MGRILVVDDDADIRSMAKAVLSSAKHEVSLAENAYEALNLLEKNQFDLVVSDANMPNISGFELVRRLRASPKYKGFPIALFTSRREREDIERAMSVGVSAYIIKPFDPVMFIKKIESLLSKSVADEVQEITLNQDEAQADVVINVKTQIISVSEVGLYVQTNYPLVEGDKVNLNTPFFRMTLGIQPPIMKVTAVQQSQRVGVWSARLIFVGAGDSTLNKIRTWINLRTQKNQKRTS